MEAARPSPMGWKLRRRAPKTIRNAAKRPAVQQRLPATERARVLAPCSNPCTPRGWDRASEARALDSRRQDGLAGPAFLGAQVAASCELLSYFSKQLPCGTSLALERRGKPPPSSTCALRRCLNEPWAPHMTAPGPGAKNRRASR